jgi:hypothetical protein
MRNITQPVGAWERGAKNLKPDVIIVQELLRTAMRATACREFDPGKVDGLISRTSMRSKTLRALEAFEGRYLYVCNGLVEPGGQTIRILNAIAETAPPADFPPRPSFGPVVNNKERAELFEKFEYRAAPTADNPEAIQILGDWERKNIVSVELPQLSTVTGGKYRRMRFHRLASRQLVALWAAWEEAGLLDRVKTYEGSFVPRFVRGSTQTLSNHAFGSAFDINYRWNKLKKIPAAVGEVGSVRELVPLANEHGFYWGGHYRNRPDGMHFEVAVLM